MKQFDEWWNKKEKENIGSFGMKWIGRLVWKAALEWAYKEIATYEDNGIIASDQVRVTFTDELYGGDTDGIS